MRKGFRCRIRRQDALAQCRRRACILRERRKCDQVDRTALRMQIEKTLGELRHLRDATGDRESRQRMLAQIFERPADEIAHVDQRDFGQAVKLLHRGFGSRSGRGGHVGDSACACHVDPLVDGMNPGRAGIRDDDSGRAEDGKAADDAKTRAHRACGQRLAAGNRNLHLDVNCVSRAGDFRDGVADHPARHGIDRRLPRRNRQAGTRHGADAFSCAKDNASTRRCSADRREHQRPMRHVGVVAGILDDAGGRGMFILSRDGEREGRPLAFGQCHFHGIGEFAREQRRIGGLRRRSGARARGPASAQRGIAHRLGYNAWTLWRHSCRHVR